jgi:hypothetical protein
MYGGRRILVLSPRRANQWNNFRRHFEPVATRKLQSSPAQPHDVIGDKA